MLKSLHLDYVGPAPHLEIVFKPRVNLLVGDNGLGKTFLLDVAWWALTRTWARGVAMPHDSPREARISFDYTRRAAGSTQETSIFDRASEKWPRRPGRPAIPGLVIYSQVEGGVSVWDPARNYWKKEVPDRPPAYLFTPAEVWEGNPHCEGLIRDWASWQRESGVPFEALKAVLCALSPSSEEPLQPGELKKVTLDDPKRYPTLRMAYGQDVPVIHASAGMRRVIALAYLLVWAWREHVAAAELLGTAPAQEIILLIDEIEAHLHPQWQRRIVPALLEVMAILRGDDSARVQLVAATHSPLILASMESRFDEEHDGIFHLALERGEVRLTEQPWAKQGDVVGWLVSDAFGLRQGRSLEAERAIEAAEAWMRGERHQVPEDLRTEEAINAELRRVLAGHDPFWPRWVVWAMNPPSPSPKRPL